MRTPEQVAVDVVEKREGRVIYPMTQIAKGNILSATLAVRSRDAEWRSTLSDAVLKVLENRRTCPECGWMGQNGPRLEGSYGRVRTKRVQVVLPFEVDVVEE